VEETMKSRTLFTLPALALLGLLLTACC